MVALAQFSAAFRKSWLNKSRRPFQSAIELLSPLLLISLLACAFNQSSVISYAAQNYAELSYSFPGDFTGLMDIASGHAGAGDSKSVMSALGLLDKILGGPLPPPSFDQFVTAAMELSKPSLAVDRQAIYNSGAGQPYANLFHLGTLHLAPRGPAVDAFVAHSMNYSSTFGKVTRRVHESESAAVTWINENSDNERAWALIVLNDVHPNKGHVDYTLRFNYTTLPNTDVLVNPLSRGLNGVYQFYYLSGFYSVQSLVDSFAFNYTARAPSASCSPPEWLGIPFPTAKYDQNSLYQLFVYLLGILLTLATLYPLSTLVKDMVEEKESRMRETMAAMGMDLRANAAAWWMLATIIGSIQALGISLIAKASFFPRSQTTLLFVFFETMMLSQISLAFVITALFGRARLASIVTPVVLSALSLPRFIFVIPGSVASVQGLQIASLSSVSACCFGISTIVLTEAAQIGITWANWAEGEMSVRASTCFMLLDAGIYLVVAAYLEAVVPTEHGSPKNPLFFLLPLREFAQRTVKRIWGLTPTTDRNVENISEALIDVVNKLDDYEPVNYLKGPAIRICSLVKSYRSTSWADSFRQTLNWGRGSDNKPTATFNAVDGLNLDIWADQITCLLGHNGAGKSTTISMLTGLTPVTSGDAMVFGKSLVADLAAVRSGLGVCPQTNVVFPALTVEEHLYFFARIKGVIKQKIAVDNIISDVGLNDKKFTAASALSGGMKRKLCLAMALIGDTKVVYLDEPTSGMDPYSRRATWDLIRRAKKDRVVVLTTHFMDEADILGDRIAIMSSGRLRCVGSPLWLKARFGVGYNLSVSTTKKQCAGMDETSCIKGVEKFVLGLCPAAETSSAAASEILFRLPRAEAASFPSLFKSLDSDGASLGISAYGLSVTTLEEVFIRISEEDDSTPAIGNRDGSRVIYKNGPLSISNPSASIDFESDADDSSARPNHSVSEYAVQFFKRSNLFFRDAKGIFFQFGLPVLLFALIFGSLAVSMHNARRTVRGLPTIYRRFAASQATIQTNAHPQAELVQGRLESELAYATQMADINKACSIGVSTCPLPTSWLKSLTKGSDDPRLGTTSNSMSTYLLDKAKEGAPRFGAYVGNDIIPATLTVNWTATAERIPQLLSVFARANINFPLNVAVTNEESCNLLIQGELQQLCLQQAHLPTKALDSASENDYFHRFMSSLVDGRQHNMNKTTNFACRSFAIAPDGSSITLNSCKVLTTEGASSQAQNVTIFASQISTAILALTGGKVESYHVLAKSPFVSVLHNVSSYHSLFAFEGYLRQAVYNHGCFNESKQKASNGDRSMSPYIVRNHPLPFTTRQTFETTYLLSLFAALFMLAALCCVPPTFATFVVNERARKSKHLQLLSGGSAAVYWMATYTWDMLCYSILTVALISVMLCFSDKSATAFLHPFQAALATFLLFLLFGLSTIPANYCISSCFDEHSTGIVLLAVNFVTGFVFNVGYFILYSMPETRHLAITSRNCLFVFFPPYLLGEGLLRLPHIYLENTIRGKDIFFFSHDGILEPIIFMAVEALFFVALTLLLETRVAKLIVHWFDHERVKAFTPDHDSSARDEDILEEEKIAASKLNDKNALQSSGTHAALTDERSALISHRTTVDNDWSTSMVLLKDVHKVYPPSTIKINPASVFGTAPYSTVSYKHALRGVSIAIPLNETFGFLGTNGAGKSTTLSILTGDIFKTRGIALINGQDVGDTNARSNIGYCPQEDPLLDLMTGEETLIFYGQLKGLGELALLLPIVHDFLRRVDLFSYKDKPCGCYSGGMKRKLSFAIALIGEPSVLLLDEPSSGMDPVARRKMWDIISKASVGRSIILTTHSMDECEALCSRVGIMVGGRLQCLGSVPHLKNRFCRTVKIEIRCRPSKTDNFCTDGSPFEKNNVDRAVVFVQRSYHSAKVDELHENFVRFEIASDELKLADAFQFIESIKATFEIEDYSVSHGSLEQVFMRVAQQNEPTRKVLI